MQFLHSTSPRGKNPASPASPKGAASADAERLRNLLAGKGAGLQREDGVFVSSPSFVSSTQPHASASVAARRTCIMAAVQDLLTPRPPEEQAVVKDRIDVFLTTYRPYCTPPELLRVLEETWRACDDERIAEPDRVRQNILYLVWRWINTAYSHDFLKENGLPDPAPYKALSSIMLYMSDTHQQGLSKKVLRH